MQLDKNNKNTIYIQRELVHNALNLSFSILGFLLLVIVLLLSSIEKQWMLVGYSSWFILLMLLRIVLSIKVIIAFNRLFKKINPDNLDFYITKSWTRKKEGSIWVGLIYIFTLFIFFILTMSIGRLADIGSSVATYIILGLHLFIVIIVMYINLQMITDDIKIAEKRINIHSVEWVQIRKDQANYYRQLFVWYIHAILILPLILMAFPFYRNIWNKG